MNNLTVKTSCGQTDSRQELASKIADYLINHRGGTGGPRSFFVLEEHGKPVPVPCHWRRMNARGVTFQRGATRDDAKAWIIQALLAGYIVSCGSARGASLVGRGLEHGAGEFPIRA